MTTITLREQLLDGVPVAERRLTLAGAESVVLEGGDGPPVVLLHGPGGNGTHWAHVLGPLAADHRVIAPDLPGQGASEPVEPDRLLDWLAELIERTCAEPPVLVGHAVSGAIAARYAADHELAHLVLVDALGLRPFEPAPRFGAALEAFLAEPDERTHDELWRYCALDLDGLRERTGDWWRAFAAYNLDRVQTPSVMATLGALMERFGLPAIADVELERIAVPTALIWGRHDLATPLDVARTASARYGWPLHVIEDCAQDPPVEQPEALAGALGMALADPPARFMRPHDDGFADATRLWNGMIATRPAYAFRPASTEDVVRAVSFARDHGLPVAVRGGGHNVAGTAHAPGGVTLDMSALRGVDVDPVARTATVQAGCLLQDVDRATQSHGLATPLGFYSEVGVAGLTLGGGIGYLSRRFGWTVDNLLEVEIVTADGRVRRASRQEDDDLFWAVRGAGARLGVVTEFTFRLHEVGPTVVGGLIAWPFERAEEIFAAYRDFSRAAPRELAVWLIAVRAPEAPFVPPEWQGERVCAMAVCYSGDRPDEALAPIRALGEPVFDVVAERPYTEVQSLLDGTEPKGEHYYWKSDHLAELSDEFLETLRELAGDCPIPLAQIGILHPGGALNECEADDGVVGNRDARYTYGLICGWAPDEPRADEYRRWIRDAHERVRRFGAGSYINFQSADEGEDRIRVSYGANYDRLMEVKRAYDPDDVFRWTRAS